MKIDKARFIYNSINRDISQSNLCFWRDICIQSAKKTQKHKDTFELVKNIAEKENNIAVIKFLKELLDK